MPSKRSVLLGNIFKSQVQSGRGNTEKNLPGDTDIEVYSLHYFVKLACEGQTVALDMLHAPDEMILISSPIWKRIVAERDRFYSKRLSSFIRYARSQAAKYGIKGARLKAVQNALDVLTSFNSNDRMKQVWDELPRSEYCCDISPNPDGVRQIQICGKIFQETASVGYVTPILTAFCNEYGNRARLAASQDHMDWKALSHAMRSAIQLKELLTTGEIRFPLADGDYLREIKLGHRPYGSDVGPALDLIISEVEALFESSTFPEAVDFGFWDDFICNVTEDELFRGARCDKKY